MFEMCIIYRSYTYGVYKSRLLNGAAYNLQFPLKIEDWTSEVVRPQQQPLQLPLLPQQQLQQR